MKTENNLANKIAFMAQYWGQKVVLVRRFPFSKDDNIQTLNATHLGTDTLLLTPIDQITDAHLQETLSILKTFVIRDETTNPITKEDIINDIDSGKPVLHILQPVLDYLRSKGFAVPWRDLSVEDLVSYGWVKLKS